MEIPEYIQVQIDEVLVAHRHTFLQATYLFERGNMFEMMDMVMSHMNIKNGMEGKHLFVLYALGKALVDAGHFPDKVKTCQLKMIEKHQIKKEQQDMFLIFFSTISQFFFAEFIAFLQ